MIRRTRRRNDLLVMSRLRHDADRRFDFKRRFSKRARSQLGVNSALSLCVLGPLMVKGLSAINWARIPMITQTYFCKAFLIRRIAPLNIEMSYITWMSSARPCLPLRSTKCDLEKDYSRLPPPSHSHPSRAMSILSVSWKTIAYMIHFHHTCDFESNDSNQTHLSIWFKSLILIMVM